MLVCDRCHDPVQRDDHFYLTLRRNDNANVDVFLNAELCEPCRIDFVAFTKSAIDGFMTKKPEPGRTPKRIIKTDDPDMPF